MSTMRRPVDWSEIFMKQYVGKCKQINFQNLYESLCIISNLGRKPWTPKSLQRTSSMNCPLTEASCPAWSWRILRPPGCLVAHLVASYTFPIDKPAMGYFYHCGLLLLSMWLSYVALRCILYPYCLCCPYKAIKSTLLLMLLDGWLLRDK